MICLTTTPVLLTLTVSRETVPRLGSCDSIGEVCDLCDFLLSRRFALSVFCFRVQFVVTSLSC